jgi:hypothetical protein
MKKPIFIRICSALQRLPRARIAASAAAFVLASALVLQTACERPGDDGPVLN